MLDKVVARSRPVDQFVENRDGPKGLPDANRLLFCGIEPARRRDSIAGLGAAPELATLDPESIPDTPGGRNGLVEGVGRDVCDMKGCWRSISLRVPIGGNREGTVPARARRPVGLMEPSEPGIRSGKLSWLGDSGIFSRRGVEWPLVGGPQMLGETPSCAWISRALWWEAKIAKRQPNLPRSWNKFPTVSSIDEFPNHAKGIQPLVVSYRSIRQRCQTVLSRSPIQPSRWANCAPSRADCS